jgi:hypothetical protein
LTLLPVDDPSGARLREAQGLAGSVTQMLAGAGKGLENVAVPATHAGNNNNNNLKTLLLI